MAVLTSKKKGPNHLHTTSGTHSQGPFLSHQQEQDSVLEGLPYVKLEALQTGTLQWPGDTSQRPSSVDWEKKGGQVTLEDLAIHAEFHPPSALSIANPEPRAPATSCLLDGLSWNTGLS